MVRRDLGIERSDFVRRRLDHSNLDTLNGGTLNVSEGHVISRFNFIAQTRAGNAVIV